MAYSTGCCYLDNAATTKVLREAAERALFAMTEEYGNPSSLHAAGVSAAKIIETARRNVAMALGCTEDEAFFTSGGTESINTALLGAARKFKAKKRHIVSTAIEHSATLNTLKRLEQEGFEVTLVNPDKYGEIQAEQVISVVRDDTSLVSIMAVNNEVGTVLPVKDISRRLTKCQNRPLLHCDMVQAFTKTLDLPVGSGADMISVSGHKIGAPKGCGALYIKRGISISPLIFGGGQENQFRAGTENVPGIAAFGFCCEKRHKCLKENISHIQELNDILKHEIVEQFPNAVIISPDNAAPHILCVSIPGTKGEVVLRVLSENGVYVSSGSACARGRKSHVLSAMKLPQRIIDGALRISFCPENTVGDVYCFITELKKAAAMFSD